MLLAELQEIVMRMVLESYGIKDGCDSHIGSTTHPLLVMKNQVPEMPVNNVTFPCHTDKSFTTILPQKQVGGLEIETKDGNWIAFEPPSPLPCVIAGDAFMVIPSIIFYVTSTEKTHHNNSRHKVLSLTFPSSSCHKSLF